jgi:hypothetical protein
VGRGKREEKGNGEGKGKRKGERGERGRRGEEGKRERGKKDTVRVKQQKHSNPLEKAPLSLLGGKEVRKNEIKEGKREGKEVEEKRGIEEKKDTAGGKTQHKHSSPLGQAPLIPL